MLKDFTLIFLGYNPIVKTFRNPPPRSFRVEIDISADEYDNVKNLNTLPEGMYQIEVKPILEDK